MTNDTGPKRHVGGEFVSVNPNALEDLSATRALLAGLASAQASLTTPFEGRNLVVVDYVCRAGPRDASHTQVHQRHSLSFVRRGSFGCRSLGERHELAPGGFLVGVPGDEFECTHEHHLGGDECLSFQFSPELADEIGADERTWRRVSLPPGTGLAPVGALAQATAQGQTGLSLEEMGLILGARFVDAMRGTNGHRVPATSRDARRAVEAALWIDAHAARPIQLGDAARQVGLSAFHFLRVFAKVLGITPNQYLVACRLRHAAGLLSSSDRNVTDIALEVGFADLSNFQRTFKRSTGITPGRFRKLSNGDRKFLQVRLAHGALC